MKRIIIEENVFSEDEEKQATIESAKKFFEVKSVKHFVDYADADKPDFWRGSMGLKSKMKQVHGISETDLNFNATYFLPHLKEHALNNKYFFLDAASVCDLDEDFFPLFIRPAAGTKSFSGNVFQTKKKWIEEFNFLTRNRNYSPFITCVFAPIKKIGKEFRLVVVNGQVVAGCMYLKHGHRSDGLVTKRAVSFTAELLKNDFFLNFPSFTIDVCESENKMKLIEINSIHTSSFYSCNLDSIYHALANV